MSSGIVLKSREETEKIVDLMCAQIEKTLRGGAAQDVQCLRLRQSLVMRLEEYFDAWIAAEPCPIEYSVLYDRWSQLQEGWLAIHQIIISDMFRLGIKDFRAYRLEDYEWRVFTDLDAALADNYNGPDDELGADEEAQAFKIELEVPAQNEGDRSVQHEVAECGDEDPERTMRHVALDAAAIAYGYGRAYIEDYLKEYYSSANRTKAPGSLDMPETLRPREILRRFLEKNFSSDFRQQLRDAKSPAAAIRRIEAACEAMGLTLPGKINPPMRDTVARELGFRKE